MLYNNVLFYSILLQNDDKDTNNPWKYVTFPLVFMIVYEDDFNQLNFENIISDKNYNASQCALYKDDIDDLVEGEMWMP